MGLPMARPSVEGNNDPPIPGCTGARHVPRQAWVVCGRDSAALPRIGNSTIARRHYLFLPKSVITKVDQAAPSRFRDCSNGNGNGNGKTALLPSRYHHVEFC